ncbi:MAG TPA: HEAT repeat domain-containing protein [Phycisphaerales bacterium]|nr:HEAT repeat domain-containing protein [Phycisphaerales bacterium]HMP38106.1 HEAT repeat domain-containing protein [Phycisphaerales bacterium]
MHRQRTTSPLRAALAPLALGAAALAGCDTLSSDFSNFFSAFNPPTPEQAAEWALDPYDAENRRRGTTLLANAPWGGSEPYLNLYRDRVATEQDPLVLAISIEALARHGTPADAPAIAAKLTNPRREVRWSAARGLQRIHNPAVIVPLAGRVVDLEEAADVRMEAAIALGQYPDDRAFQALAVALDARELSLNDAARASMTLLTGEDFGLSRVQWLRWYDATSTPFAGQRPFLYPTFTRPITLGDRLVFWAPVTFETPAPPAGLRDEGARGTYDEPDPRAPALRWEPTVEDPTPDRLRGSEVDEPTPSAPIAPAP